HAVVRARLPASLGAEQPRHRSGRVRPWNGRWIRNHNPNPGSELLADEAQVVSRFEVGNPVVEKTDAVRLAKAIQFVEPDRSLAQALSEVLEEELKPTWRVQLDDARGFTPPVPHGVEEPGTLRHPAPGGRLDALTADPGGHPPSST